MTCPTKLFIGVASSKCKLKTEGERERKISFGRNNERRIEYKMVRIIR